MGRPGMKAGVRGEHHFRAKLNEEAVRAIRAAHAQRVPYKVLAREYGVACQTVYHVIHRDTWRHVA